MIKCEGDFWLKMVVESPGIESTSPALEGEVFTHWITREVPGGLFLRNWNGPREVALVFASGVGG